MTPRHTRCNIITVCHNTIYRYDFHRGVDIPKPAGTPVRAIACGKVRIAGSHPAYSDGVVQVRYTLATI